MLFGPKWATVVVRDREVDAPSFLDEEIVRSIICLPRNDKACTLKEVGDVGLRVLNSTE